MGLVGKCPAWGAATTPPRVISLREVHGLTIIRGDYGRACSLSR